MEESRWQSYRASSVCGALDEDVTIRAEVSELRELPDRPGEYEEIGEALEMSRGAVSITTRL